ncbi:hypothetical protein ACMFMF_001012 [Clarireedia jacksonii]
MQPSHCAIQKIKNDMVTSGETGSPVSMGSSGPDQPQTPKRDKLPLELTDVITPALRFGGLSAARSSMVVHDNSVMGMPSKAPYQDLIWSLGIVRIKRERVYTTNSTILEFWRLLTDMYPSALSGGVVGGFSGIVVSPTPILFAAATSIQWGVLGTTFWGTRIALLSRYHTPTRQEKSLSSTLAASLAGATGGLLRGRKNVLSGFFVFGAIGYLGQWMYDAVDGRKMENVNSGGTAEGGSERETWMRSKWVPWKALTDEEYEALLKEKLLRVDAEIALLDESLERLKRQQKSVPNGDGASGKKG